MSQVRAVSAVNAGFISQKAVAGAQKRVAFVSFAAPMPRFGISASSLVVAAESSVPPTLDRRWLLHQSSSFVAVEAWV